MFLSNIFFLGEEFVSGVYSLRSLVVYNFPFAQIQPFCHVNFDGMNVDVSILHFIESHC